MSIHLEKLNSSSQKVQDENAKNIEMEQNRNYYLRKRPLITLGMTFGFSLALAGFFAHMVLGLDALPTWWPALYWIIGLFGIIVMTAFLIIVIRNDRKLKITKEVIANFRNKRRQQ